MFNSNEYEFILHEIKNNITLISCSVQMIEKQHPEVLDFVHWDTVSSGLNAMRDFFYQSALMKSCKDVSLETIPGNTLIDELKKHIKPLCSCETVSCTYHIDNTLPNVNVDISKFRNVILNLVKNALEAMKEQNLCSLTFHGWSDTDSVYFSITDTGIGMDEITLSSIFVPMFTTKIDGCGLGLPLCKQIIEAHHGKLLCKSTPDVGTTFTIQLPIA